MGDSNGELEAVQETVLTGPPVRSFRAAMNAVAFYATEPAARPRPGWIDRLLWGLSVAGHAARILWHDRRLLRSALLPTALTLLGAAAFAALVALRRDGLRLELGALATTKGLQSFLVTFVAVASMPPTLLQRQWLRVAHEARRALGLPRGEDPFPGESYLAMLWREGLKTIRQGLVVSFGLLPVIIFIEMLPFGDGEATLIGAAWTFYWVVVDAFELPVDVLPGPRHDVPTPWYTWLLERLARLAWPLRFFAKVGRWLTRLTRPWGEEVHFTERHGWETAGFAAGIGVVLAIPVAGLFFRSVAITAATDLIGRLGPPVDEAGPPPVAAEPIS